MTPLKLIIVSLLNYLYMNHFVKSLWWGALFSLPRWKCVLKRNPFMSLLIAAILFVIIDLITPKDNFLGVTLLLYWVFSMCLCAILPSKQFKLVSGDKKTLYFFLYDMCDKRKHDAKCSAVMRVLMKKDGKLRQIGDDTEIRGYDDSLHCYGFFLAKCPYGEWILFGNGYDKDGKPMELGQKMTDYVFISTPCFRRRKPTAYFLHEHKLIKRDYDGIQLLNKVFFDEHKACCLDMEVRTNPGYFPSSFQGQYILLEYQGITHLFKLYNEGGYPLVYIVQTDWFTASDIKNKDARYYVLNKNKTGYVPSDKVPFG